MFNNYKKNKSKNTPKDKLPKFTTGGGYNEFGYNAPDTDSTQGSGDGLSNFYSTKRNEGKTKNNNYDQYAQYGQIALNTGSQLSANQNLHGDAKSQADYNAVNSGINSVAGAATPWYGYAKGASDMGRGMIARDSTGKPVDKTNAQMDAVMKPQHEMITEDLTKGNTGLAIAELLLPGIGYESRSNSLGLGKTINNTLGVKNDQYTYAYGGINMQPNAEVEKQENTLNPDGTTTQFNGPTHEQGGIPTNLDPGTMIFSDKLKYNGKTFAQLNKANLTHHEDKILNDPSAKKDVKDVANALKSKKINNSLSLFKIQEEMKQSKLDNYTKRLGGIQKYPLGGATDNTKYSPAQQQQAYNDSLTLYKSGFNKNVPNWQAEPGFNDAVGRLHTLNGVVPQSTDKSATAYANDPTYLAKRSVPYAKPTKPVYEVNTEKKNAFKPTYGNYNMPMKGLERPDDFNPQLQQVPANSPNTVKTNIVTGPNMSYKEYKQGNEILDRMYFNPQTKKEIEITGFRNGGIKLPKYGNGNKTPNNSIDDMSARNQQDYQMWYNANKDNEGFNPDDYSVSNYKTQYIYDTPTGNAQKLSSTYNENQSGINNDNLYQLGFGLAQNAGQLSYLMGEGKNYDKQEFYNYNPNTLNPTADLRDAQMQNNRAEYNVRGASGGNAGTYLSNRVALNAQNTMNKSRIHQAYENANAGIKNQAQQYNIANKYATDDINARNKGAALNQYYKAIGSLGVNTAQGLKDNKTHQMDEKTIGMFTELYNNPEFQKFMKEQKK